MRLAGSPSNRMRLPLITRILAALAAVGLLPLIWATASLINVNTRAMRHQALSSHLSVAESIAGRLDAEIERRQVTARILANHPVLQSVADSNLQNATELLRGFVGGDPTLAAARLLDPSGNLVLGAGAPGYIQQAESFPVGGPRVLWLSVDGHDWIEVTVASSSGNLLQVISITEPFKEVLESAAIGDEATTTLVDRTGATLAGSDIFGAEVPSEIELAITSSRLSGSGEYADQNGINVQAAFASLRRTDWLVISSQPVQVAQAISQQMRRKALWMGVGALALVGGISAIAYFSLVRPIQALTRMQQQLGLLTMQPGENTNEVTSLRRSVADLEERARNQQEISEVFLGRYQILEVLGRGAAGWVFRGWDPKLRRPVALKTVHFGPDSGLDPDSAKALLAEAVVVARFNHPNIVSIYDVLEVDDTVFVAMELIDGVTGASIFGSTAIDPKSLLAIGVGIADALSAAHQQGVIHRDIKPGNILFGYDRSIKVADFGIASAIGKGPDGDVFGTPGYVAPEIIRGEAASEESDLFSLGVVLFIGATGEKPFDGHNTREILRNTLIGDVISPHRLNPRIPPALGELIERLLDKDKNRRSSDAGEVAVELRALASQVGMHWDPPFLTDGKEATAIA